MIFEPELVASFLLFMIAPLIGFYAYAHIQAYRYNHVRGDKQCSLKSISDPP